MREGTLDLARDGAMLALVVLTAPGWLGWRILRHLWASRRIARRTHGKARYAPSIVFREGSRLVAYTAPRNGKGGGVHTEHALSDLAQVEVTHTSGDGGYADANTLYYLVSVCPAAGAAHSYWICESHPFPLEEELFGPLRERGLLREHGDIDGLDRGAIPLLVFLCVPWLLIAGLLYAWLRAGSA